MTVPEDILGGRYALGDPIASGGMATVHLGRVSADGGFGRIVAIKRLQDDLVGSPEHESVLREEARLASRIGHPNVVATLDIVREGSEMFLVMEHVVGQSLAQLVFGSNGGKVEAKMAAGVICGVLEGLNAAHLARGGDGKWLSIVHRDVSPENVIVGVDGLARLLDFGIAQGKGRDPVTRAGQLKGKFGYMPPEVLMGEEATQRGDLYAAAVVFWEMLTGERLFEAGPDGRQVDIIPQVVEGKIDPPSTRTDGIVAQLDAAVMKGLSREPHARYESAREFAMAIEDCLAVASSRRIGEWVLQRAAKPLAERATQLEQFERRAEQLQSRREARAAGARTVAPKASDDPNAPTEAPGGSLTEALRLAGAEKKRRDGLRRALGVWRALALVLAAGVVYLLFR